MKAKNKKQDKEFAVLVQWGGYWDGAINTVAYEVVKLNPKTIVYRDSFDNKTMARESVIHKWFTDKEELQLFVRKKAAEIKKELRECIKRTEQALREVNSGKMPVIEQQQIHKGPFKL
ncbi:hypothetical protein [Achromobacter phage Motura]|uniref:Uncharacterized protein n=1 Tax=Achromobacter phage Motura TaxID=2591403 RepID=A0A514CSX3_9CAUD|nr:hypothetical protein H1O15_gp222 [Achromobacter phage Motura]QDH83566.1 hypothetical protein [Achromobacter phage Motura]